MSSKRIAGIELLKGGHSYSEIKFELKVAKSTINSWFSQLSDEERKEIKGFRIESWKRSIQEYRKKRSQQILAEEEEIQEKAAKQIKALSKRELFLIGTSLYWAEGSKSNRWQLQFSNSDPEMIKLIIRFFQEICRVRKEKLYLQMILHENVEQKTALNYWSKITKIPKRQFKKACYALSKASKKIRKTNKLPFGTLQIRVLNKRITNQIYGYIKGLKYAGVVQQ